jgi:hypothetical protein
MRTEVVVVAVLAAGGATAVGVSACGSSGGKPTSNRSVTGTTVTTAPAKPAAPATITVRVAGKTSTLKLLDISFAYCRQHASTCAAVTSAQQRRLTPNQRKAVKAAAAKVKAQEAAASQPAPQPLPEPQPAPAPQPAPQPQPQSGGETTTG